MTEGESVSVHEPQTQSHLTKGSAWLGCEWAAQ